MNLNDKKLSPDEELDMLLDMHPGIITPLRHEIAKEKIANFIQHNELSEESIAFFHLRCNRITIHKPHHDDYLHQPAVHMYEFGNRHHINRLTHADDVGFWADTLLLTYNLMMELPPDERKYFSLVASRRLLEKDELHHSYLYRIAPFEFDDANCPVIMIIQSRRINLKGFPQFRHFKRCPASYTETHAFSAKLLNLKLPPRVEEAMNWYVKVETEKNTA